jgi:hypothetical protein
MWQYVWILSIKNKYHRLYLFKLLKKIQIQIKECNGGFQDQGEGEIQSYNQQA